jgi:hypothetical protein
MDGLLSEVVSLKALMSFWTFISMSKNSQAEPSAMSGQERLGYGEPLGAENHSMNQNSNAIIQPIVDNSMHVNIYFRRF